MVDGSKDRKNDGNNVRKKLVLIVAPACDTSRPVLGPSCLCAAMKQIDIDCSIYDLNSKFYHFCEQKHKLLWATAESGTFWLDVHNTEKLFFDYYDFFRGYIDKILVENPTCIGFSLWYSNATMSFVIAREMKRLNPFVKIIFGGPEVKRMHLMPFLYASYRYKDMVDLFVIGEGELILGEIIKHADDFSVLKDNPDLIYKEELRVASYVKKVNLDDLPTPDFSSLDVTDYTSKVLQLPLYSSRGCINKCIYCDERKLWRGFRTRSAENIFNDVVELKKKYPDLSYIEFADSLINGNIKILRKFAELMADSGSGIKWGSNAVLRPEMERDLLTAMAAGGCTLLIYGLESASSTVHKFVGKNFAVRTDIERVIRETAEAGISVILNFMFGLPGETEDDARINVEFIVRNKGYIHSVIPSAAFCNICPGTDASENPEKYGIRSPVNATYWESIDGTNTYPVRLARFERFIKFLYDNHIESNYPYPEVLHRERDLALYYEYKGDLKTAYEHFRKALEKNKEDAFLKEKMSIIEEKLTILKADVYYNSDLSKISFRELNTFGEEFFKFGNTDKAIKLFKLSLEKNPDNPDTLNNLGVCFFVLHQYNEAEDFFRKCIEIHPSHREASVNLNHLYYLTKVEQ